MNCSPSLVGRCVFAAVLVFCATPFSGPAQAAGQQPTRSAIGPGDVNTSVSRVYTFVDKTGLGHQHAIEGKLLSGRLMVGARENAGQLVFDMRSFDADTTKARRFIGLEGTTSESTRTQVNDNMRGSDVLDVSRYPTATFDVVSVIATGRSGKQGPPVYSLSGTFTLHGVTKPLEVNVEIDQQQGWLHLRGSFSINQTNYGITPYSKAFGAIGVADQLRIHGDLYVAPNSRVSMQEIPHRK
ncbi:MAG: YceI family protein [Planctomycetales bacterium]|nr:YceI family protein [Planctomycetales bacterium]